MKKFIESILSVICLVAIILAGSGPEDGSCCFPWTLSWLAVAFLAGLGLRLVLTKEETE